ncbi:MAG TPA: glycoside hydrolase family 2 TIM barrel-domain containing protein [Chryseosolibacter sp.]
MRKIVLPAIILLTVGARCLAQHSVLDLSGPWTYALDSLDAGEKEQWTSRLFENTLHLPGTLDDNGVGRPADLTPVFEKATFMQLTRKHRYVGAAWYSREVVIPGSWKDKNITLQLGRVIWETQVWVDGRKAGMNESLVAPHEFDLSGFLSPGKHILTLRIDNREKYDVSLDTRNFAHAYTDGTQIIWNGVIGDLRLLERDKIFVGNIQVYPDVDAGTVRAVVEIQNPSHLKTKLDLTASISGTAQSVSRSFRMEEDAKQVTLEFNLGKNFRTWDEFDPNLYTLTVDVGGRNGKTRMKDLSTVSFGMRKVGRRGNILQLNNHRIFLRGTLECAIFPLTGHPPMKKDEWANIFRTARSYGLNHLRFHSWCPPEAAFEAADEAGFYLQIELPLWSLTAGEDKRINQFVEDEANRIIRRYGNHPSFCFWSMGNELQGNFDWMTGLLSRLKAADSRHLYTTTTFTFQKGRGLWPEPVDDFYVTQYTKKGWVRGQGIFDREYPSFNKDYRVAADSLPVPLVSHEIGQYSVYPNLQEIGKYTGVLEPLNFKAIEQDLKKKGMLASAADFTKASGQFAVALYKEEIERALKTPQFSGFQLLDLHDFPGQGTALVGILDAFWESKGLITPEGFREFCAPVVPLIRYEKAVYTSDESFDATAEVANFGNADLHGITPEWSISTSGGKTLVSGKLQARDIPVGNGIDLGQIHFSLQGITEATALTVELALKGTPYKNHWKIWVYPSQLSVKNGHVVYTRSAEEAMKELSKGNKVLLNPEPASVNGIEGKFVPVFWSPVHFPNQPGSMGILCNPSHGALANFPTESHSDWQWWYLCKNSKPMLLDSVTGLTPIVRVVDNFYRNRKLATLAEAKVGNGKLMSGTIDLGEKAATHPEVRQLRFSILEYMNSGDFNPSTSVAPEEMARLIVSKTP